MKCCSWPRAYQRFLCCLSWDGLCTQHVTEERKYFLNAMVIVNPFTALPWYSFSRLAVYTSNLTSFTLFWAVERAYSQVQTLLTTISLTWILRTILRLKSMSSGSEGVEGWVSHVHGCLQRYQLRCRRILLWCPIHLLLATHAHSLSLSLWLQLQPSLPPTSPPRSSILIID